MSVAQHNKQLLPGVLSPTAVVFVLPFQRTESHFGNKCFTFVCSFFLFLFVPGMVAGMCQPRVAGTVGAEPFSAKLRYSGAEDIDHPNLIKLTVTMPHIDGENSSFKALNIFTN